MTQAKYDFNTDGDRSSVSFVLSDECRLVTITTDDSPDGFPKIVSALLSGTALSKDDLNRILNPNAVRVTRLDERVGIDERTGALVFDGTEIHDTLAETIVRHFREGRDTSGLVKFLENLAKNPSRRSREHLFNWTKTQELRITPDGCFIGYKGVKNDHTSVHAGPATVDGVEMNGYIPNRVGSVISVPRDYVDDDYSNGCSHGLHVGNYRYARNWAHVLLEVKVNPADVVTVPNGEFEKLRCARYEVLAIHEPSVPDDAEKYEAEPGLIEGWDDDYELDPWDDDTYDEDFEAPLATLGIGQRFLAGVRRSLGRGRKASYDDGAV